MPDEPSSPPPTDGAEAAALLRQRDFMLFWGARFTNALAVQIQAVAIGWQVYDIARRAASIEKAAFIVGMIGLAQFLPLFGQFRYLRYRALPESSQFIKGFHARPAQESGLRDKLIQLGHVLTQ